MTTSELAEVSLSNTMVTTIENQICNTPKRASNSTYTKVVLPPGVSTASRDGKGAVEGFLSKVKEAGGNAMVIVNDDAVEIVVDGVGSSLLQLHFTDMRRMLKEEGIWMDIAVVQHESASDVARERERVRYSVKVVRSVGTTNPMIISFGRSLRPVGSYSAEKWNMGRNFLNILLPRGEEIWYGLRFSEGKGARVSSEYINVDITDAPQSKAQNDDVRFQLPAGWEVSYRDEFEASQHGVRMVVRGISDRMMEDEGGLGRGNLWNVPEVRDWQLPPNVVLGKIDLWCGEDPEEALEIRGYLSTQRGFVEIVIRGKEDAFNRHRRVIEKFLRSFEVPAKAAEGLDGKYEASSEMWVHPQTFAASVEAADRRWRKIEGLAKAEYDAMLKSSEDEQFEERMRRLLNLRDDEDISRVRGVDPWRHDSPVIVDSNPEHWISGYAWYADDMKPEDTCYPVPKRAFRYFNNDNEEDKLMPIYYVPIWTVDGRAVWTVPICGTAFENLGRLNSLRRVAEQAAGTWTKVVFKNGIYVGEPCLDKDLPVPRFMQHVGNAYDQMFWPDWLYDKLFQQIKDRLSASAR